MPSRTEAHVRLLLVEDNRRLNEALRKALAEDGYAVDTAFDGVEAEELASFTPYDVIVLDVMLPKRDGIQVCKSLRDRRNNTPILMLTARDGLDDRVLGLDSGADDYLVKPFEIKELRARLRALARRRADDRGAVLTVADLSLDPATHEVRRGGAALELTAKEYALLEYLLRNRGRVVTREMILGHLWDYGSSTASNVVDVHMRRLRSKVDDPFREKLIETVRGAGYRIRAPGEER
jgi:two-component system, OmpR family, copper resistance phosphate regulon response regulator CusR